MPDLIRLVHGNRASIQKLVKEFREYWSRRTTDQNTSHVSSFDALGQEDAMDTSTATLDSSLCATPARGGISKRQLDMTIRSVAAYSKKETYNKKCWYVKEDVLQKYQLTNLPVPTTWIWVTRPNKEQEETGTPKLSATPKTSGRETPILASTPNSITKFAVPKSQLPSPLPLPATPKSRSESDAQSSTSTCQAAATSHKEKLTPKNLMSIKSAFAAVPRSKKTTSISENTKQSSGSVGNQDLKSTDDDCMIVDVSPSKP